MTLGNRSASPDPTPPEPPALTCSGKSLYLLFLSDPSTPITLSPALVLRLVNYDDGDESASRFVESLVAAGAMQHGPCPKRGRVLDPDDVGDRCDRCGSELTVWVPERPEGVRL